MAKKQSLPWGSLVKRSSKNQIWYWMYFNRDQKRTRWISTRTGDKAEAFKIAKGWAVQYLAQRDGYLKGGNSSGVTLYYVFHDYLEKYCLSRLSDTYLEMVAIYFDKYIIPHFGGDTPINSISASMVSSFGNQLISGGLSTNTANKVICNLSKLFKWAAKNNWIEAVPYISRLPVQRQEHGYELSDNEIEALLTAAETSPEHVRRFVILCLYCGLRHTEAVRVRWEDVDFQRGVIHLSTQKNRSSMPAALGKARGVLEAVPPDRRTGTIVAFQDFLRGGSVREVASLKRSWKTLRKRAGLPDCVRIHDLRHTFVSRMFRAFGYDARFLSRHSSNEAFIRYLHADLETLYSKAGDAF